MARPAAALTPPTAEQIDAHGSADDLANGPANWERPSNLKTPAARKGFRQRWIRVTIRGEADGQHMAKKFREGWKPRMASTAPKGFSPPTIKHGSMGDVIGVEGLVLCEMPERIAKQRDAWVQGRTHAQMQSIRRDLNRVERPGMPLNDGSADRTARPRIADDVDGPRPHSED